MSYESTMFLRRDVKQLPHTGKILIEGFQYEMPSIAKSLVRQDYGISIPDTVTCLYAQVGPKIITIHTADLEEGTVREEVERREGREATFFFYRNARRTLFTLDCTKVADAISRNREAEKVKEENQPKQAKSKPTAKAPVAIDLSWL